MTGRRESDIPNRTWSLPVSLVLSMAAASPAWTSPPLGISAADEAEIRKVLETYERAIEGKDVPLFRQIKPNLTAEEELRLRAAFESIGFQDVQITVESLRAQGEGVAVLLRRRDNIDHGRLIAAFPQTLVFAKNKDRWTIHEIRK